MRLSGVVFVSFLLVLACILASADEVHLEGGGALKGTVVSEDDEFLVLKTAYGTVTLEISDVTKVLYSSADEKKILAELARIEPSEIKARLQLAKRAAAGGLGNTARRVYAEILAVEPDQQTARRALGYERYEEEWVLSAERGRHEGLVPYKGRWVSPEERDSLAANDADREYFSQFDLTLSQGYRVLDGIADFDIEIEPRGGYIVRRHVRTYAGKDKPYLFSVDALTWKRLGVFIGVSFIDETRRRVPGFGELEYTIYSVATDALGNKRPDKKLLSRTVAIKPEMWDKKSDFTWWDTKINHSAWEKNASEEFKTAWRESHIMNFNGVLYILANRDADLLKPPITYYMEARFSMPEGEKTIGRYVFYAQPR